MNTKRSEDFIRRMIGESPRAFADVRGSSAYPDIRGMVLFFRAEEGTLVFAEFQNLPYTEEECEVEFYGFHIHEGHSCTGNATDPFANAGTHLNPNGCEHPAHMGDLPPVMGSHGYAWAIFYTDRFRAEDVKGRTVIVHRKPDDFKTQPSGDSGAKIACGVIQ